MATITSISPGLLAEALGVNSKWVREILRANYWRQAPGQGGHWRVTPEMAEKVAMVVHDWRLSEIDRLFA